jgi:hypothetical protein
MRVAERPSLLPLIDTTLSNVIDWANTPYWYTGFAPGQVVPSAPHNTLWLLGALWNGYLDYGTVRTDDYLESSVDQRWSTDLLAYNVGEEVITLGAEVDTYVTYYVGGYRIEVDAGLLRPYGALPLLQPGATLPGRLWVYLNYGIITDPAQPVAAIRVESVAAGVPASPAAGELPLVGVDLNALGVVTGNTYDAGDPELGLVYSSALPQAFLGNVVFVSDVELQGPVVLGDTLELGGMLDGAGFSIVNVDAFTGESLFVNNQVDCSTLVTVAGITCGGALDMDTGAIANATTVGCTAITCTSVAASANVGGATLSSSASATVGTTLDVTGVLTATGGLSLPSGADATGTSGTTFTGGTLDTLSSAGIVKVGEIQFYSDTTPSTTGNVMQSFGRGLTLGLSTVARRISIPFDNYVASLVSTASSTATGATIDVVLVTGDVVYVTASADLENDTIGTVIVFEIVVNGVIQNSAGNLRSDTAGVPICCNRTVKYTAASDAVYTFVQRYGATAGNTLGVNGFISVRQGN